MLFSLVGSVPGWTVAIESMIANESLNDLKT
jgi:hypothetical protein